MEEYFRIVVGKTNLVSSQANGGSAVSEDANLGFIDVFIPLSRLPTCSLATPEVE
jgi:hypothetical protein